MIQQNLNNKFVEEESLQGQDEEKVESFNNEKQINKLTNNKNVNDELEEFKCNLIQPLDLVQINSKPSYEVLKKTLDILKPKVQYNFDSNVDISNSNDVDNDSDKNDQEENLLDRDLKLNKLIVLWLTNIISSNLKWLNPDQIDDIYTLTSKRIAERCGNTARPAMQRKILLCNNSKNFKFPEIILNEPSLTEDNLGLKTWGSSYILSQALVNKPELLSNIKNKSDPILELGSGTGLVGITAYLLGYNVIVTDLPQIVENLEKNIESNIIKNSLNTNFIKSNVIDWSKPMESDLPKKSFKSIIISDPIYSSEHPPILVNTILSYLNSDKESQVILQLPLRNKFSDIRDNLYYLLEKSSLCKQEQVIEQGRDDFGKENFCRTIWKWE